MRDEKVAAGQALIDAISSGDAEEVTDAFEALYEACRAYPHKSMGDDEGEEDDDGGKGPALVLALGKKK